MAPDVADIILSNEWILKLLDNRNYQIGGVDPETLPGLVRQKSCRLNIKGHMVDVLSYEDNYTEVDGTVTPYIPAGTIAVGAPAAGPHGVRRDHSGRAGRRRVPHLHRHECAEVSQRRRARRPRGNSEIRTALYAEQREPVHYAKVVTD